MILSVLVSKVTDSAPSHSDQLHLISISAQIIEAPMNVHTSKSCLDLWIQVGEEEPYLFEGVGGGEKTFFERFKHDLWEQLASRLVREWREDVQSIAWELLYYPIERITDRILNDSEESINTLDQFCCKLGVASSSAFLCLESADRGLQQYPHLSSRRANSEELKKGANYFLDQIRSQQIPTVSTTVHTR